MLHVEDVAKNDYACWLSGYLQIAMMYIGHDL